MAEKKKTEAPSNIVESFMETNQAIAESIMSAQERNLKFAQSTFMNAMEVVKHHIESTRTLMQQLEQQTQKQQEVFLKMERESEEAYKDFFRSPFSSYQKALETAEAAAEQGLENFQKALENVEKATQKGLEDFQKATKQATSATQSAKD